jgi:hypothetical protein
MDDRPIYSFTLEFRHPKEGHFNSHHVKPPLSAQRAHQMNEWVAHTKSTSFLGSDAKQRRNIKRSALGECSLRRDTRVETANEGRFSSQVCSERVDLSQLLDDSPKFFMRVQTTLNPVKATTRLVNFISALHSFILKIKRRMDSGKIGTGKYPFYIYIIYISRLSMVV